VVDASEGVIVLLDEVIESLKVVQKQVADPFFKSHRITAPRMAPEKLVPLPAWRCFNIRSALEGVHVRKT
jgi:hypothetical protein